jgi:two-component system, chemotaxis family, CheB/CheR fusion protein
VTAGRPSPEPDERFEGLLEYLRDHRGFDFTGYKRSSLQRRIAKRMHDIGVEGYEAYQDMLEVSPEEFGELFNSILINVSSFFRDPPVWAHISDTLIPKILQHKDSDAPIRVWSAACATGEEPYTIAMLLAEALGEERYRDRVKVFATDVDDDALERARQATYARSELRDLPEHMLERYFEGSGDRLRVTKDLRRPVIFGRNDLVRDAPISRIDLLTCRNTMIYFNSETQRNVMARFHLALGERGFLVLGKSELILTFSDGFTPENLGLRIFQKVAGVRLIAGTGAMVPSPGAALGDERRAPTAAMVDAFQVSPVAQLVLDREGTLVFVNEALTHLFGVAETDIGKPLQDLELSYRPVELRSLIDRARAGREPVRSEVVSWRNADGEERELEVQIAALLGESGEQTGTSIAFLDVTQHARVAAELESSKHQLETAYEDLRATVEELETTNEELQSTNEELETTNEELQSTNEELETMNEELQSSNEELETMNEELQSSNEELRIRTTELNNVNVMVDSMLESMGMGIAVLDRELRVRMWNQHAKRLWGLDADEVRDHAFLSLDIGLPVQQLGESLRACLDGDGNVEEQRVEARDRAGREIICRVVCTPLTTTRGGTTGAIVLMQATENRSVS